MNSRSRTSWTLAVVLFCSFGVPCQHGVWGQDMLLTGGRVLDVEQGKLVDAQVLVSGNRIRAVGQALSHDVDRTTVVDLGGLVVMPGLIDLHSHLLLHPYNEASWNDQVLKESLELRTVRGTVHARNTVEAGFTTIRDLGTEGAGFADVALRDAINSGMIPGPRVFAVTRALVTSGGYGPSGFDPRFALPKGAQVADGVDGVRIATREQIAAGADWIKVYADYRRKADDVSTPTFTLDELKAVVDEARSAGLKVSAHATTNEGIRRAVLAGVATIEHGYDASRETLDLMKEHGVVLCPTLAASEAMAIYSGWRPGDPESPRILTAKRMLQHAIDSGVTIACGSDVGVFAHGTNARELELMFAFGMEKAEVIRAATITAAKVLDREKDLGTVTAGKYADLIVVAGNPLDSLETLRQPVIVIKDGQIVIDRRQSE